MNILMRGPPQQHSYSPKPAAALGDDLLFTAQHTGHQVLPIDRRADIGKQTGTGWYQEFQPRSTLPTYQLSTFLAPGTRHLGV